MLIEERVRSECDRIRVGLAASAFHSDLAGGEDVLADKLVVRALAAFERGKILLIVNDRQVIGSGAMIDITEWLDVTFVRLVPLQGG